MLTPVSYDELSLICKDEMSSLSFEDKREFMLFASVKYGSLDAVQRALQGFSSVAINEMKDISRRSRRLFVMILRSLNF